MCAAADPESWFSLVGFHRLDILDSLFPHVAQSHMRINCSPCLHVRDHEHIDRPSHVALADFKERGNVRISSGHFFDVGRRLRVSMVVVEADRDFLSREHGIDPCQQQKNNQRDKNETVMFQRLNSHQAFLLSQVMGEALMTKYP